MNAIKPTALDPLAPLWPMLVEPPRVQVECQSCQRPSEKVSKVGERFLCDECKTKPVTTN